MSQKRILTLLPIIFLLFIFSLITYLYISFKIETNGCLGFHKFSDEGMDLNFKINCEWKIVANTNLDKDSYKITLTNDDSEIIIDALKINENIGEIELSKSDYEIKEINSNLIRFNEKSASEFYYADTFSCSKAKEKKCTGYVLTNFSSKFHIRLKAIPNGLEIAKLDKTIEKLLEKEILVEE